MSRREEVEASIHRFSKWLRDAGTIEAFSRRHKDLALTLADEVDALRANLLALGKKTTRYENEREINAGLVADRDAIIDKLLDLYKPCEEREDDSITQRALNGIMGELHVRACEIAGRVK